MKVRSVDDEPDEALDARADERAVLGPLIQRVGRAVGAEKALAIRDKREDVRFLGVRERARVAALTADASSVDVTVNSPLDEPRLVRACRAVAMAS